MNPNGTRVPKPGLPKKYAKMGFKKGWKAFKASKRTRGTTKGQRRRMAKRFSRRASNPRRTMARRKMITPHPSITGMAAGFSLVDDLNKGDVVGQLLKGSLSGAINTHF